MKISHIKFCINFAFIGIILFLSSTSEFSVEKNFIEQEFDEEELVESSKFSHYGQEAPASGGDDLIDFFVLDGYSCPSVAPSRSVTLISDHASVYLSIPFYLKYCCLKINC